MIRNHTNRINNRKPLCFNKTELASIKKLREQFTVTNMYHLV